MVNPLALWFRHLSIKRLERQQARPMREVVTALLAGNDVPEYSRKKLLELDQKIGKLRRK